MKKTYNKSKKWKATPDKENCLFYWKISLKNGYQFTGYSKYVGEIEHNDKPYLLSDKIHKLICQYGYLNPYVGRHDKLTESIYFYKRRDSKEFAKGFEEQPFIKLYPQWYEINNFDNLKIITLLDKIYEGIKSNNSEMLLGLKPHKPRKKYKDPLNLQEKRFTNENHLNEYCNNLIKQNNRQADDVNNFRRKYAEKYFGKIESNNSNLNQLVQSINSKFHQK